MTDDRGSRPRILIAMIEAGGGHRAPALALAGALERLYPGRFEIDVVDFMKHVGDAALDRRHKASWAWMLQHPKVTYRLQQAMDELVPIRLVRAAQGLALRRHSRNAERFLRDRDYALAVALHFMPLQAIRMARSHGHLDLPLVGVTTDPFDAHALWAERGMDELIVASEQAKALLVRKGVPDERVSVYGYPLNLSFLDVDRDPKLARVALGLQAEPLTVVHTAGGEGIGGNVERIVRAVLAADLDLQYVVMTGRNEGLLRRLEGLAGTARGRRTRLHAVGFTHDMARYLVASDLVLGKAGGASTWEALALDRPVFHTSYVAPNEKRNVDFCVSHGVGRYLPRAADVVATLTPLATDKAPLLELASRIRALDLTSGTLDIARHLASLADAP